MAEKREHSPSHSCSARFVYPVSFVSLLICTTALVRVEIIHQRVRTVEDFVASEVKQTPNTGLAGDAVSFKQGERVKRVDEFDHKDTEDGKDKTEGKIFTNPPPPVHSVGISHIFQFSKVQQHISETLNKCNFTFNYLLVIGKTFLYTRCHDGKCKSFSGFSVQASACESIRVLRLLFQREPEIRLLMQAMERRPAIFKTENGESEKEERGTGNGERGTGNGEWGIFKMGNL